MNAFPGLLRRFFFAIPPWLRVGLATSHTSALPPFSSPVALRGTGVSSQARGRPSPSSFRLISSASPTRELAHSVDHHSALPSRFFFLSSLAGGKGIVECTRMLKCVPAVDLRPLPLALSSPHAPSIVVRVATQRVPPPFLRGCEWQRGEATTTAQTRIFVCHCLSAPIEITKEVSWYLAPNRLTSSARLCVCVCVRDAAITSTLLCTSLLLPLPCAALLPHIFSLCIDSCNSPMPLLASRGGDE